MTKSIRALFVATSLVFVGASFGACASATRFEGAGDASTSASASSSGAASSSSGGGAGGGGAGGAGPCTSAPECAALTDACNTGTCVNGKCVPLPANEMAACDDGVKCTDAACMNGSCVGAPKDCPGSDACHVGSCDPVTEACLETAIVACQSGDGCCAPGCDFAADNDCAPPTSFKVLNTADVTYQGIDYLVLEVDLYSTTAVAADWCYEYQNLCAGYGFKPTGCGQTFTNMANGYGACKTTYGSDGVSDSLGCNPSGGVAAAANQAGFAGATSDNSFGFHYCDAGTCTKVMCSGMYCNTALSYIDASKLPGYTLCKK